MNAKTLMVSALFIVSIIGRVEALPILNGSVSFNPMTNLYTYSYLLDNSSGPAPITDFAILIDSTRDSFPIDPSLTPIAHTEPPGWSFVLSVSGTSAFPPLNESGTFYEWNNFIGVPVGNVLSGFSFTTDRGPTPNANNNFLVFSTSFSGGPPSNMGIVEFGHIVGPDFGVPEPSSFALLSAGVLGLIGSCWGRLNRNRNNL